MRRDKGISSNNNRGDGALSRRAQCKEQQDERRFRHFDDRAVGQSFDGYGAVLCRTEHRAQRIVANMQHAVYYELDEERLMQMAEDDRSSYVLAMKEGQSVEIGGHMVRPAAYGRIL